MFKKTRIEDLLFLLFAIIAIVLIVWFVVGGSPTLEQAMLALVLGLAIKNHGDIKELKGRIITKSKWEA